MIPITTSPFALIFYSNSVFSCASFSAVGLESGQDFQYGFWGFQYEFGECQNFKAVDGILTLGRVIGIVGFIVGLAVCFLLSLLCCFRAPKHILHCSSAAILGMATLPLMVFTGIGTHFCSSRSGDYRCRMAMSGYVALASALLWIVGGISLRFIVGRFEETNDDRLSRSGTQNAEAETLPRENLDRKGRGVNSASRSVDVDTDEEKGDDGADSIVTLRKPDIDEESATREESTAGATSKTGSKSIVVEREQYPDGRQVTRTTKTDVRPDGTRVIERDIVTSPAKKIRRHKQKAADTNLCQAVCGELSQCNSIEEDANNYRDLQMLSTTSGLTDDSPIKYRTRTGSV